MPWISLRRNLQNRSYSACSRYPEGNIDITPAITMIKDEIGPALNKMINAIGLMSDEINRCCLAALKGNLSYRADATSFPWKNIRKSSKASTIQ